MSELQITFLAFDILYYKVGAVVNQFRSILAGAGAKSVLSMCIVLGVSPRGLLPAGPERHQPHAAGAAGAAARGHPRGACGGLPPGCAARLLRGHACPNGLRHACRGACGISADVLLDENTKTEQDQTVTLL